MNSLLNSQVMNNDALKDVAGLSEAITSILSWCQRHMRDRKVAYIHIPIYYLFIKVYVHVLCACVCMCTCKCIVNICV